MQCILHIGTEKTGTTSFQRWLEVNRGALRKKDIVYPSSVGVNNHRKLSVYSMDFDAVECRIYNVFSEAEHNTFRDNIKRDLEKEIELYRDKKYWIFSSEHLHSRIKTTEEMGRLFRLLKTYFESILVILHLRPQVDVAVSLASTQSRVGGIVNRKFFEKIDPNAHYYNYNKLYDKWKEVFGESNIRLISFKKNPNLLDEIAKILEIDQKNFTKILNMNRALDVETIALVNMIASSGNNVVVPEHILNALPFDNPLSIGLSCAKELQSRFNASNLELINKTPWINSGDLLPIWEKYDKEENLSFLSDISRSCSKKLSELIIAYNNNIKAQTNN